MRKMDLYSFRERLKSKPLAKVSMKIRVASPADAPTIREICSSLNVARTDSSDRGFVEYPVPDLPEWIKRIHNNPFFYVAEEKDEIIGFCSSYPDSRLKETHRGNPLVVQIEPEERPFIYCELLGVRKSNQNRTVGISLLRRLINDATKADYKAMYSLISHAPHRNRAAIRINTYFFGSRLLRELESEGLIFGLYKREL